MTTIPNEDHDTALAEELIFKGKGVVLERFSRAETQAGPTPDFRLQRDGKLIGYCEVKSPRDEWLTEQINAAPPGELVGGHRNDPVPNRLSRQVTKAAGQFKAVNPGRSVANILVFVNHDDMSNYGDLREILTGTFFADDGSRHSTLKYISEGRIGKEKQEIDLYVWVDAKTRRVQGFVFNETDPARVQNLCDLLALDVSKIA